MGETVAFGSGLTEQLRTALYAVLGCVVPAMFKSQQPWALMGSTSSVLQGLDNYAPPDIDIVTSMEGAYIMEGAVARCGATIRPVSFSVREPYASHFGIFEVEGVKVEVMGNFVIRGADGEIDANRHWARWSDKVRLIHFEGMHVPVVPLEWQLVANVLLQRPERYGPIAELLLRSGYDCLYVDALLADERHGGRTIALVRELLHLDA
jgi:Aminoglycoside-2''-adenylyltransferase